MTRFAFSRGQGSVYAELPPTLQPFAIASAAPRSNHLRSAGYSGLIYLLLASSVFAFSALGHRVPVDMLARTGPDRIFVFDPPRYATRIELARAAPAGRSGQADTIASTQTAAPAAVSDEPAATLSNEDHTRDRPTIGNPASPQTRTTQDNAFVGPVTGTVVHDFSQTGLEILQKVDPIYPAMARLAHVQGSVILLMTVDEAGVPTMVQVLEGHPALLDAATRAARQWRFVPARLEGHPVAASFRLTIKFALR